MNSTLASYKTSEILSDGRNVHLRAIRPSDREMLREQFLKLSKASVRDRFFSLKLDLTADELTYFTEVDFNHHVALVAELESGSEREPVAVGRLVRKSGEPDNAEIAITVADAMQGKGIGKIMLKHLIDCARQLGVRHMDASVMAGNTRMMKLIRKSGLPYISRLEDGVQTISVNLCA
ncbi:MAG: GNAT family N-acetyltransferase [Gammaproteobacteria bacterium]|jgi:RimJ/RimL family protein N-acetyltransferase|nr:GNAT family N-acetyltransferase [Gammaproteobacteria bacterium]